MHTLNVYNKKNVHDKKYQRQYINIKKINHDIKFFKLDKRLSHHDNDKLK